MHNIQANLMIFDAQQMSWKPGGNSSHELWSIRTPPTDLQWIFYLANTAISSQCSRRTSLKYLSIFLLKNTRKEKIETVKYTMQLISPFLSHIVQALGSSVPSDGQIACRYIAGVERTFKGRLVQPYCNEQGHLQLDQVDQNPVQPDLECFQGWGIYQLSEQPVPGFHHPHCTKFLPCT